MCDKHQSWNRLQATTGNQINSCRHILPFTALFSMFHCHAFNLLAQYFDSQHNGICPFSDDSDIVMTFWCDMHCNPPYYTVRVWGVVENTKYTMAQRKRQSTKLNKFLFPFMNVTYKRFAYFSTTTSNSKNSLRTILKIIKSFERTNDLFIRLAAIHSIEEFARIHLPFSFLHFLITFNFFC